MNKTQSDGGPSSYYDFNTDWGTLNDLMEHLAKSRWLEFSLHLKDAMKACMRFGGKAGTEPVYDAKKLVYTGLRLIVMIDGRAAAAEYLATLARDPQFRRDQ